MTTQDLNYLESIANTNLLAKKILEFQDTKEDIVVVSFPKGAEEFISEFDQNGHSELTIEFIVKGGSDNNYQEEDSKARRLLDLLIRMIGMMLRANAEFVSSEKSIFVLKISKKD